MSQRVYFDHAATSPLRAEAREAMLDALAIGANASSVHAEGRAARSVIEMARRHVAELVGMAANRVVFTSGGTEANALSLSPGGGCDVLLVSAIEHDSVRSGGRFAAQDIRVLPVDDNGVLRLDALEAMLAALPGHRPLLALMLVNNETGVLQPVVEAAALVHAVGGLVHVDAVQAAGKLPLDMASLGADMLTLSAHKLGGPQGIGALIMRSGLEPDPLFRGGGQERSRRAGTEATGLIAGFGAVAALAKTEMASALIRLTGQRERLEQRLLAASPRSRVLSRDVPRAAHIINLLTPGQLAETAVIAADLAGLAISAGSACSSGKVRASHVLQAMGLGAHDAGCGLRFSLGWTTTDEDIDRVAEVFTDVVGALSRK